MIGLTVAVVDRELLVNLERVPDRVKEALESKLRSLMGELRLKVEENLSGKVLQTKSGALKNALEDGVATVGEDLLVGFVDINPEDSKVAAYALVHEYGGKGYYEIVPVRKRLLRFEGRDGEIVFAPYVYHPPAVERSYLRSALHEMEPTIVAGLETALADAL